MKKHTMKITAAALILIATLGGCVKGDKGDTGPAGTNGTNGTNGSNGNANVTAYTITVNASNWASGGSGFYYVDVPFPQITADVVNKGTVSMFKQGNAGVWVAMPYSEYYNSSISFYYGFNHSVGTTRIFLQNSSGGTITFSGTNYFKAVIIPSSQRRAHPETNWNNYKEVQPFLEASESNRSSY